MTTVKHFPAEIGQNTRLRVLMVVPYFYASGSLGGAERQAHKLAKTLSGWGLTTTIVAGWWKYREPRTEVVDTIPVQRVFTFWNLGGLKGLRKFGNYAYILALLAYLIGHRHEYDIIHVHSMSPSAFIGALAGRLLGKKSISKVMAGSQWSDLKRMEHNLLVPGSRYMLPVIRRYCDCVVALNGEIAQELRETGFASDRIVRIPNGVIVNDALRKDDTLHNPLELIFVGRLQPQKGLDILLQALAHLKLTHPAIDWRLRVCGDGPNRAEYEQLAASLGLAERVYFAGYISDLLAQLSAVDLFILPSRAEGMSNALLEAMAAGLPCIATRISGNTDLIEDGVNGLLVPPDAPERLAEALAALLDNQPLRKKLADQAQQTVRQHHSIEAIAGRYVKLYQSLLALPGTSTLSF